ncbi:MAG TPA: hypothetical protein VF665_00090 [Longimicrobium sp.]|uniref:hypothetical protein n=1 Tax=Longimicrobium sp. TaxID=2029185 RepID=UPI002ED86136
MIQRISALALVAAALLAAPASAQRTLNPGQLTRGTLSSSDPRLPDRTYYDEYMFAGRRGETVIVTLESDAFDAYLYLGTMRRGTFQELARDDDGGGTQNARLEYRLPEDGTYVIRASSLAPTTGEYRITLVGGSSGGGWSSGGNGTGTYERPGQNGGYIRAGEPVRGRLRTSDPTLDDGGPFHIYRYSGRRGERLSVNLRSVDFDAYLVVGTPGGRHGIQSPLGRDDDSGGGHDARLDVTLPNDGEYAIRVNAVIRGTGEYTLDVQSSLGGGYTDPPRGGFDEDEAVDELLVGRWELRERSYRNGTGMGRITIDEDGGYVWRRNGRVLRGQLVAIQPRRMFGAETEYYAVNDGREEFYLYIVNDRGRRTLRMNSRLNDTVVAEGQPEAGSY